MCELQKMEEMMKPLIKNGIQMISPERCIFPRLRGHNSKEPLDSVLKTK